MIPEIGHFALILAFLIAIMQTVMPMVGAMKKDARLMAFGDKAAIVQFLMIAVSFAALTAVFLASDFSVKLAASHSHSLKPFIYKISGVWGNHEGSILLWVLMLSLYGALVPVFGKKLPAGLKARALSIQGLLGFGFLGFILFTSNPFERLNPVPLDGAGLNPLLQDPGLAIHPPLLYMGYVGFSIAFSFSVAALLEGKVDAGWARWLRPWVLTAWSFLTLGITMGSLWAYYELGWGGWWMWDPVENVSFLPWLVGTALLHSILVLGKRHTMSNWTALLGITAFSLSMIGTFVVRSGVLVSVHSFASDPERGVYLLLLCLILTGSALTLYAFRYSQMKGPGAFDPVSREGGLIMNNLLLTCACATVFLGTFYPLFMDAVSGDKISVGAPFFDRVFAPIMVLLILFMGTAPLLKWQGGSLAGLKRFFAVSLGAAIILTAATLIFGKTLWGGLGLALAAYLALGTLLVVARRVGLNKTNKAGVLTRIKQQPRGFYGFAVAHFGMAVFVAGVTFMSVWSKDDIGRLKIGEKLEVAGYSFVLDQVTPGARENFQYLSASIDVTKFNRPVTTLRPEQRFYPVREMITTEAAYRFTPGPTIFAAIGEGNPADGWIVRAYYHPGVIWIWLGAFLMALAGFMSLSDPTNRSEDRGRNET